MALNRVTLIGNVGKRPETRTFENGSRVTSFTLATTERYTDRDGERRELTEWHNVTAFGRLAETAESLPAKIDGYNALLRKFGYMSENCRTEIDRLTRLRRTAENAQKSLKRHVLDAMNAFGFDRLEGGTCKMSKGSTTGVEVDEDTLLAGITGAVAELAATLPAYVTLELKVSKKALSDGPMYDGHSDPKQFLMSYEATI